MTISRNGFQAAVFQQPAPAVVGDFASMNPRATALAGPGAYKADSLSPVLVGNFAWGQFSDGVAYGVRKTLATLGFIANELQTVITDMYGISRLAVQAGFPVTLFVRGDFFAFVAGGAVAVGAAIYADRLTGTPTVDNGAFAATGVQTASTNIVTVSAVTAGYLAPGDTITGSGVAASTVVVSQTSGTPGGAGTYTVSNTTGFASTGIAVAAPNPDTLFRAATSLDVDSTSAATSLAAGTGILTVGAVTGAAGVQIGANLTGTGVPPNLFIVSQLTGTAGQTGTYKVNTIGPAFASTTVTYTVGKLVKISRPA